MQVEGGGGAALAALQREWGNSVQPLKKSTQVQPIPKADEFHSGVRNSFPNCQQPYEMALKL